MKKTKKKAKKGGKKKKLKNKKVHAKLVRLSQRYGHQGDVMAQEEGD